jgi:hypothetical protein
MAKNFKKIGKKLGRKTLRDTPMTERLSVRLTPREMKTLKDASFRYDSSPSDLVRFALAVTGVIPDWM